MNIYAHVISCQQKVDNSTVLNCFTNVSPSMEDSIEQAYAASLKRWPKEFYFGHQVHADTSQQIPQEWIDRVANQ